MKFLKQSQIINLLGGSPAKRAWRAGKKEGGLREGIFARLLPLGGGWVCVAFGDAQVSQNFVQNRFVLRSVIATKCNFYQFWGKMIARSPRLRLGSLRKFPYILGLNQKDGQNQKLFFCPAGGGSFQFFLFRFWWKYEAGLKKFKEKI